MRYQGKISRWNDDKGFGFITPDGGGRDVFVHISGFVRGDRRPSGGENVTYAVSTDERKRVFATQVTYEDPSVSYPRASSATTKATVAAVLFLAFIGISVLFGYLPLAVLIFSLVLSCLAFVMYGDDKAAAINDRRRTPESLLQLLALLGGWPGALVAQWFFRHKSRKLSFQIGFWITVFLNCAVVAWFFFDPGFTALRTLLSLAKTFALTF